MFGCGLPVAAVRYPTLSELVEEGVNGCAPRAFAASFHRKPHWILHL